MAAPPVMNPPTPYTSIIPGGFFPGKMIRIQGFAPMHGQRFDINLQTGAGGEIAGEDVALHASVRLTEGYIARNSFQGGCWQEELGEGGLPIQLGQRFEILLLCEAYEYKVAVNGQHFCSFPPRVPYNRITHLMIEGDVQLELIAWEGSASASAPPMNGPPQYGAPVPPPQYTPQQTYIQQAPPPPPGAKSMPMPTAGIPPVALSYGPGSGIYPNLDPHFKAGPGHTAPFGGQPGPHPGGVLPPMGGVSPPMMPHPSHPTPGLPNAAHRPFPSPTRMPQPTPVHPNPSHRPFPSAGLCHPDPPHCPFPASNPLLSDKAKHKIAKAEYKVEKKIAKEQRRAEKKLAKAERKAHKRHGHGLSKGAAIGLGVGAVGATTLAYAAMSGRRSSSSSTSSTSSSD